MPNKIIINYTLILIEYSSCLKYQAEIYSDLKSSNNFDR